MKPPSRSHPLLFLPVVVALVAYSPTLSMRFLADDYSLLTRYHEYGVGEWLQEFGGPWAGRTGLEMYRPLITCVSLVDRFFWGMNPVGWHLTNVLLHAAITGLFTATLLRVAGRFAAVAGGTLFALHPVHVESVAWVAGRVDLVATLLALLSVWLFVAGRKRGLVGSWVAFAAALMAKESIITTPAVMFVVGLVLRRPLTRVALTTAPHFLILAAYFSLRVALFGQTHPLSRGTGSLVDFFLSTKCLSNFVTDAYVAIAPVNTLVIGGAAGAVLTGALCTVSAVAALAAFHGGFRRALVTGIIGLVLFGLVLIPALPLLVFSGSLNGGRLLYAPSLAVAATLAVLLSLARRRLAMTLAVVLGALYVAALVPASNAWKEDGELAQRIVQETRAGHVREGAELPLFFIDLPQSNRGTHLLVNGFLPALGLSAGGAPPLVETVPWEVFQEMVVMGLLGKHAALGAILVARFDGEHVHVSRMDLSGAPAKVPGWGPEELSTWPRSRAPAGTVLTSPALTVRSVSVAAVELVFRQGLAAPTPGVLRFEGVVDGAISFQVGASGRVIVPVFDRKDWFFADRIQRLELTLPARALAGLRRVALLSRLPEVRVLEPADGATFKPGQPEPAFALSWPSDLGASGYRMQLYVNLKRLVQLSGRVDALAPATVGDLPARCFRLSAHDAIGRFDRLFELLGACDLFYVVEALAPAGEGDRPVARSSVHFIRLRL